VLGLWCTEQVIKWSILWWVTSEMECRTSQGLVTCNFLSNTAAASMNSGLFLM
ncbi:hypothetical protein NDU88_002652, partial [Pleurodeles waltl]